MYPPILVAELELTAPITDYRPELAAGGTGYNGAHLLVRLQGAPVGYVSISPGEAAAETMAGRVWQDLGDAVNRRRADAGLDALTCLPVTGIPVDTALDDEPADRPLISVVVCTRNRPESLLITLRRLTALRYAPFEVVVVDNASSSDLTRDLVHAEFGGDPRFRYVREPRPGLSCARNRGLAEAASDIVAFTDDDVRVDPDWLTGILRGFRAAPNVACVTGLITTAEINNAAQLYFHLREGWGASCERRTFDLTRNTGDSPLYPYTAGVFGSGANFALSRPALKDVGSFNEALGAGTPSGGGEDLNIFMRIVLAGYRLVYEPTAVVAHVPRADVASLSRQMRAYGSGCTAALTAVLLSSRQARRDLPPKAVAGINRMRNLTSGVRESPKMPPGLLKREAFGFLAGPGLYLKGRLNLRYKPELQS